MDPNTLNNLAPPSFKVKLLFGLFEANASGVAAISAVVVLFVLMGAGRRLGLW